MMKKLLLKTNLFEQSPKGFRVFAIALFSLVLITSSSFGQTVVNFTTPTASSVNAVNWAGSTAYTQFQYIYNGGNLYRIWTAGTSDTNYPPTGIASGNSTTTSFINTLPLSYSAVAWVTNTPYNLNQYIFSSPNLYKVSVAGTSGATAPVHSSGSAADGTVTLDFISTYLVPTSPVYEYISTIPITSTWTCPAGVTSIQVEAWGAGGGGGGSTNTAGRSGGGGGGGSYVKNGSVTVTPGTTYTVKIGVGGLAGGTGNATAFGMAGGFSSFTTGSQSVIASGGTGASGGTTAVTQGLGGVLGGVYGFTVTNPGVASYSASSATVGFSGGNPSAAATAKINTSSSTVAGISPSFMGTGYTTAPTITITSATTGTGATGTAIINPNINDGITISIGADGSNATTSLSGAGASGANGGVGGASIALPASGVSTIGLNGVAPGGGGSGAFTNTTTSVKGGFGAGGQVTITYAAPLPVKLTSFTASKQGAAVQLKWSTASEQNNRHFEIQRSTDGQSFATIGNKVGAGNSSSVLDYFFTDRSPSSGVNYYRLNQIDFDGKSTLSDPIAVSFGSGAVGVMAYPNPVVNQLNVSGLVAGDRIKLLDLSGRIIKEQAFSGSNSSVLNLDKINAGVYLLIVENLGNITFKSKIVKN